MKIVLADSEYRLLAAEDIPFDPDREYTDEEALELLELVYDAEIKYSNCPPEDKRAAETAEKYAHLADRIRALIPEN